MAAARVVIVLLGRDLGLLRSDVASLNVADRLDVPPPLIFAATLLQKFEEILEDFAQRQARFILSPKRPVNGRLVKRLLLEREVPRQKGRGADVPPADLHQGVSKRPKGFVL